MSMRYVWLSALMLVGLGSTAFAGTVAVPGDQPTIAAGIAAAAPGDTVLVSGGPYTEDVVINKNLQLAADGTTVTLIGTALALSIVDPATTVTVSGFAIDAGGQSNGVTVSSGGTVRFANCEITNGGAGAAAAVVSITGVADGNVPATTFDSCRIHDNRGSGIDSAGSFTDVKIVNVNNCILDNNGSTTAQRGGVVIATNKSTLNITGSVFSNNNKGTHDNTASALTCVDLRNLSTANVTNSNFVSNQQISRIGTNASALNSSVIFDNSIINSSSGNICYIEAAGTITFQNNTNLSNNAGNMLQRATALASGVTNVNFESNQIFNQSGRAFDQSNNTNDTALNITINNCQFNTIGNYGFRITKPAAGMMTNTVSISNSTMTNLTGTNRGWVALGDTSGNSTNTVTFSNVTFSDSNGHVIGQYSAGGDQKITNLTVDRCTITPKITNAIQPFGGPNGNSLGGGFSDIGHVKITNTVLYAPAAPGIWLYDRIAGGGPTHEYYHNTFVTSTGGGIAFNLNTVQGGTTCQFKNNIFQGYGTVMEADAGQGITEDHNLFYLVTSPHGGDPLDASDRFGDPLFVDFVEPGVDFNLTPGPPGDSDAITYGTVLVAPITVDRDGNPRPMPLGTDPDIGAYEEQTAVVPVELSGFSAE